MSDPSKMFPEYEPSNLLRVLVLVLLLVVMMVVVMLGRKFSQFYISQLPINPPLRAITGNHINLKPCFGI